ncbi:plasmid transfer protein TraA [Streptomyces syringium]|uniref:plasmid transfer protein TraA n=1 Tax=Streptomyces syringium TaxID=76729 RepID=UPI0037D7C8A3
MATPASAPGGNGFQKPKAPPRPPKAPKVGGGFNPTLNITPSVHVQRGVGNGSTVGSTGAASGGKGGVPGADFMSNEDIRAFCEYVRREARNRATERAMDADHLEAVLRAIPDLTGALGGSRARARRVTRWVKKIAAAEKNIQKYAASVYATFEREYDSELRNVGKGRTHPRRVNNFGWR